MPYKKGYKRRAKKSYQVSKYSKYAGYAKTGMSVASQALAIALATKRLLNVEKKFFDVTGTLTFADSGNITQCSNIPSGDTDETRDGAQVKIISLLFRAVVKINASATNTSCNVMLIQDKQTNEAIYGPNDILQDPTDNDAVISALNLDNMFRFKVLKRWTFDLNNDGRNTKMLHFYKEMEVKLRFDGSTPSIADLTTNSFSIMVHSDEATNTPTAIFSHRLRYVDN